jgi:Fe-S oxidoreductase
LGRFSNLFEEPRNIIKMIPGIRLVEMNKNRVDAICCGSTGWSNCFNCKKRIQINRLKEASKTKAKTLITVCPKCQIHLNCAQENEESKLNIKDFSNLIAQAIA